MKLNHMNPYPNSYSHPIRAHEYREKRHTIKHQDIYIFFNFYAFADYIENKQKRQIVNSD